MGKKKRLWSYITGEKGYNRIRVYERKPKGPLYIEWHDRNGRHQETLRNQTGVPVMDRDQAKHIAEKMAESQRRKRDGQLAHELLGMPAPRTLVELLDAYKAAHPEWSASHARDQKANATFWKNRLGPDTLITRITPAAALAAVRAEASINVRFKERTQQKRIRYLKDAFTFARKKLKWISESHDLSALDAPKVRGESKPYSLDEVQRLLPATEKVDIRLAAASFVAYASGRRINAIRTLPASAYSVDTVKGREYGVLQMPGATDKARKSGVIYLSGKARAVVETLLRSPAVKATGLMFPSGDMDSIAKNRMPVSDQWLRDKLREAEVLATVEEVKGRKFHGFKRRFATMAGRHDAAAAEKQSGTDRATLQRTYEQDDPEPKAELADHLDSLLRQA